MKTITEIKKEMLTTIRDYIIPFWLDNSVDTQYGGYITSFDENGKFDGNGIKNIVTQSRMVWGFSYLLDFAKEEDKARMKEAARQGAEYLMDQFWDKEYGGLLRFVDIDGGRPKGIDSKSDYENLISSTWDMKLWWPHSEMLYLYRKLYVLTKDKDFDNYYKMAFDYSFSTFPSTNNGEWVQIRDRRGKPVDKVVALPVKDPFHIMRDFLKIIKLEEK